MGKSNSLQCRIGDVMLGHTDILNSIMPPCPKCGSTKHWYNDVPLKAFCYGTEEKPHKEWSKIVPKSHNPYL